MPRCSYDSRRGWLWGLEPELNHRRREGWICFSETLDSVPKLTIKSHKQRVDRSEVVLVQPGVSFIPAPVDS